MTVARRALEHVRLRHWADASSYKLATFYKNFKLALVKAYGDKKGLQCYAGLAPLRRSVTQSKYRKTSTCSGEYCSSSGALAVAPYLPLRGVCRSHASGTQRGHAARRGH